MTKIAKAQGRTVKEINLGDKFNRLTAVERLKIDGRKGYFWKCVCDCGNETIVYAGHLKSGSTKGCGCAKAGVNTRHGMSGSPEYRAWDGARSRCYNEKNRKYPLYGGKGIEMCHEWRSSFDAFFRDMGRRPSPSHSLERVNSRGNYEPGNCIWATAKAQNRNRPDYNRTIVFAGRVMCVAEAAEITGIPHATILGRLTRGLSDEDACA